MERMATDTIKVEKLVKEFLSAQALTILPQNSFTDAVTQFVDKDDRHAMENFVSDSLEKQVDHLAKMDDDDEEEALANAMEQNRTRLEAMWDKGELKRAKRTNLKPKPIDWDSDLNGDWEDQPEAIRRARDADDDEAEEESNLASPPPKPSGGRGRGGATTSTRSNQATAKKSSATKKSTTKSSKSKSKKTESESDMDEPDVVMLDDEDDDDEEMAPIPRKAGKSTTRAAPRKASSPQKKPPPRQATLNFSQPSRQTGQVNGKSRNYQELVGDLTLKLMCGMLMSLCPQSDDVISDDDDDDDEDAFEPIQSTKRGRGGR